MNNVKKRCCYGGLLTTKEQCAPCAAWGTHIVDLAAPAPVDAGTIDTPEFRELVWAFIQKPQSASLEPLVAHIDQHTAAAVAAALKAGFAAGRKEENSVRGSIRVDQMKNNEHYRERIFIELAKADEAAGMHRFVRAATAPVSASPAGVQEAFVQWWGEEPTNPTPAHNSMAYWAQEAFKAGAGFAATIPPSAGAPVSADLRAIINKLESATAGYGGTAVLAVDECIYSLRSMLEGCGACGDACAEGACRLAEESPPVSAAEQADTTGATAHTSGAAPVVTELAGGQELPALPKHSAEFRGERLFDLYTLRQFARDALALHQPQGEKDEGWILSTTGLMGDYSDLLAREKKLVKALRSARDLLANTDGLSKNNIDNLAGEEAAKIDTLLAAKQAGKEG